MSGGGGAQRGGENRRGGGENVGCADTAAVKAWIEEKEME
jgi:hypothetical protein